MLYSLTKRHKYRPGLHKYLNTPRFPSTCWVAVLVNQYMLSKPWLVFTATYGRISATTLSTSLCPQDIYSRLFSQQTSKPKSSCAKQVNNTIPAYAGLSWPIISSLRDCLYTYNLSVNMQNSNPTSAPQYNVDPAGDLILLVGQKENQRPIRVSSKVLSLASPVFATMFGSRYLEGHVLSKQGRFSIP